MVAASILEHFFDEGLLERSALGEISSEPSVIDDD
jgi:hypothetical protein